MNRLPFPRLRFLQVAGLTAVALVAAGAAVAVAEPRTAISGVSSTVDQLPVVGPLAKSTGLGQAVPNVAAAGPALSGLTAQPAKRGKAKSGTLAGLPLSGLPVGSLPTDNLPIPLNGVNFNKLPLSEPMALIQALATGALTNGLSGLGSGPAASSAKKPKKSQSPLGTLTTPLGGDLLTGGLLRNLPLLGG